MKDEQYYVYRYIHNGEIVYIGKVEHRPLRRRIYEHSKEENFLKYCADNSIEYNEFQIEYITLPNSTETKIAEAALINKHNPILNIIYNYPKPFSCIELSIKQQWLKYEDFTFKNKCLRNIKCSKYIVDTKTIKVTSGIFGELVIANKKLDIENNKLKDEVIALRKIIESLKMRTNENDLIEQNKKLKRTIRKMREVKLYNDLYK